MKNKLWNLILIVAIIFYGCQSDEVDSFVDNSELQEEVEVDEDSSSEDADTESEDGSESTNDDDGENTEESTDGEASGEDDEAENGQDGGAGTVEDTEDQLLGAVTYRGQIPSENSKVPTCKSGIPNSVMFIITDSDGTVHEESVPATETGGLVTTTSSAPMPLGQSIVNEILLMNGNDTLYAIPHEDELELARFADVTVPFEVEITENTELTGSTFCFTQETIDIPDDALVDGGFGTQRLQTLWIDVKGECIDIITVTIDNFRVLEIFPFQDGLYDIPVPENYEQMDIRAYTPQFQGGANDFDSFRFTAEEPYNEDGNLSIDDILQFEYDCIPEED